MEKQKLKKSLKHRRSNTKKKACNKSPMASPRTIKKKTVFKEFRLATPERHRRKRNKEKAEEHKSRMLKTNQEVIQQKVEKRLQKLNAEGRRLKSPKRMTRRRVTSPLRQRESNPEYKDLENLYQSKLLTSSERSSSKKNKKMEETRSRKHRQQVKSRLMHVVQHTSPEVSCNERSKALIQLKSVESSSSFDITGGHKRTPPPSSNLEGVHSKYREISSPRKPVLSPRSPREDAANPISPRRLKRTPRTPKTPRSSIKPSTPKSPRETSKKQRIKVSTPRLSTSHSSSNKTTPRSSSNRTTPRSSSKDTSNNKKKKKKLRLNDEVFTRLSSPRKKSSPPSTVSTPKTPRQQVEKKKKSSRHRHMTTPKGVVRQPKMEIGEDDEDIYPEEYTAHIVSPVKTGEFLQI